MAKFSINGATYYYSIHGFGRPIVLLHGFTGSTKTWTNFIANFGSGLQIITIDLPGHGKTICDKPKTMTECTRDLYLLFQHLDIVPFDLIGYSMGGRTALSYTLTYPQSVKSLVLESASPGIRSPEERKKRKQHDEELATKIETDGLVKFVDYWENIPLFNTQKQLPEKAKKILRDERLSQTESGLANSLRAMGTGVQKSWWDMIKGFTKPVLLITGEKDEKFVRINKMMAERLPNSILQVVPNTGHAIHVEQPEIFGKLVRKFIYY